MFPGYPINSITNGVHARTWVSPAMQALYDEMREMRAACGEAHVKAILATGELGTLRNVGRASLVCMMGGADFIKTSTGKVSPAATLPVTLVMLEAMGGGFTWGAVLIRW